MNISDRLTQSLFKKLNRPGLAPRRLRVIRKLPMVWPKRDQAWLDLGAGNGSYLNHLSVDSFGLDIRENLPKKIYAYNFNDKVPMEFEETADVIWCSNLIEHVLRPHEFLLNIRKFLRSDGLLILVCPQTLLRNPLIYRGTLQGDHVNFYNLTTLKLSVKAAGYEILYAGTTSFGRFGRRMSFAAPTIFVVTQPIRDFQYPESAHKYLSRSGEIVFKEENVGH